MTNAYTNEMTKLAILAAIVALALAFMLPHEAHAKAKGDTIGASIAPAMSAAAKAKLDAIDAPLPPAYFYSVEKATTTTTTTHKMTKAEKRAAIKALKAEIKKLQKEVKRLSR